MPLFWNGSNELLGFDQPGWFALFLSYPLLIWARFLWRRRGGRVILPHSMWRSDEFRPTHAWLRLCVVLSELSLWVGSAILVFALTGPKINQREEIHLSRGIDIMLVLDQSLSMGARDFPPSNRFDVARDMIRSFLDGRSGDFIGLVTFGSQALLRSPLTSDYAWLQNRLDEIELRELGDDTAIGMGLAMATLHLSDSSASERVILLLTDGDDNAGEIRPEMAGGLASKHGIRIYTIGMGSKEEASIEIDDPNTSSILRGRIVTDFNEEQLRLISRQSGGKYWRASSSETLNLVFQQVDALEKVERRISSRMTSRPIHRALIVFGGLLVTAAYLFRRLVLRGMP